MKFDYQKSSIEAIAVHLNTMQRQSYHKMLSYYKDKEDLEMVSKLEKAYILAQIYKLQKEFDAK